MSKINISDLLSMSIDYQKSEIQTLNPEEAKKVMGGLTQVFDDGTTLTTEDSCLSNGRASSYIEYTDLDGNTGSIETISGWCV